MRLDADILVDRFHSSGQMTLRREEDQPVARRRERILDAAMTLMGRYGYKRSSIEDIAREAEIAKGTVYLSFAGKEDIFRALCERISARCISQARAAATADTPLSDRLVAMLEAKYGTYFDIVSGSPHAAELIDSKNRLSSEIFDRAEKSFTKILKDAIDAAAQNGKLKISRNAMNSAYAADLLMAAAEGIEKTSKSRAIFTRRIRDLAQMFAAATAPGSRQR